MLKLPNHSVESQQSNLTQEVHADEDHAIIVVIQSSLEKKYWLENWTIFRKENGTFSRDEVACKELLYSPSQLEQDIKSCGFDIVETYGDLHGNPFDANSSWRRVWLCQKT